MALLSFESEEEKAFKPVRYAFAYNAWQRQQDIFWLPKQVPMGADVKNWAGAGDSKFALTSKEKALLTQIMRFFTQGDVEVGNAYTQLYLRRFKPAEVRMMLIAFANMETIHVSAYSHMLDTIGMPEVEYSAFLRYDELRAKHDFLEGLLDAAEDDFSLLVALGTFGPFVEGLQLFASFVMLLNFQRFGKMLCMCQLVAWSVRDETLHTLAMIKLFHRLKEELRLSPGRARELEERLEANCREIVKQEDAFIDLAFSAGEVQGMTPDEIKGYIRHVADRRLRQLGQRPIYGSRPNPIPWTDSFLNGEEHANFFETTPTEYSKATEGSWEDAAFE